MLSKYYTIKRISKNKNISNMKKAAKELIFGTLGSAFIVFMAFWTLGDVWFWIVAGLLYSVWYISTILNNDNDG